MIDFTQFDSLLQVADYFTTNDICKQAIAEARWADCVAVCPYCGGRHCKVGKDGRYLCKDCNRKFNVTVGTIFENTKLPLRKWFMAMYLISSNKKGVSSCQIMRDIKVTQKTSWFLLHKIRGLYGQTDCVSLKGEVEMDEMYLGGRETNKHGNKKTEGTQGRSTKTKTPIFGMVERDGNIVAMKVDDTKGATLMPIVSQFVESGATTYHRNIKVVFPYESVLTKNDDTSDTYTEEAQRFQIEYANRYGADDVPSGNAALGYDSYLILINAFHNAKSMEGADIRKALLDFDGLKCATGLFTFDINGNVVRSVTLSTIKDGKPVTEYITKTEAEARELEDLENVVSEGSGS